MVRSSGKQKSTKLVIVCAVLLGFGLVADYLWASSPYFASYLSDRVPADNSQSTVIIPKQDPHHAGTEPPKIRAADVHDRSLSATFADLPAPELKWEKMASAPVPRLDGAAIQIKVFYTFLLDMKRLILCIHMLIFTILRIIHGERDLICLKKWLIHIWEWYQTGDTFMLSPDNMAHNFVLDTKTKQWQGMPPLPVPRYAPATQLWRGRLHLMGGSKENRHTPALEHWSLAVKDGKALEKEWRPEIPIPRGGPHRKVILWPSLDLLFKCSCRNEIVYDAVNMLDDEMRWKPLPPMPKPDSHIEFAWTIVNNSIVIAGGTTEKHPTTKKMVLLVKFSSST